VIEGQDLVGKIARVPRNAEDKPRTAVRILKVDIKRVGPPPAPAAPAVKKAAPAAKKAATPATKKTAAPAAKK
jgi:hypothetical protein